MSMKKSGLRCRAGTSAGRTTTSGALVEASTTSTSPRCDAIPSSASGSAPKRRASSRAASGEARRGELRDAPGADDEHATAAELSEDLLGERRRSRADRRGRLADRRLRADALPDLQRLAKRVVEQRARLHRLERVAHLAEDLALTGDERVQAGRDAEEVDGGRLVVQPVDDGLQLVPRDALERGERPFVRVVGDVDLGAVARREAHGIAEVPRELRGFLRRERDTLAQLDGRDVVRDADERDAHAKWPPASARRTTITSAKPNSATYAARLPVGRSARYAP
jgi:hypothetical protein